MTARASAATPSRDSRSGQCWCPRRSPTRRSRASRRSSASTPRPARCCCTPRSAAPATSWSGPMSATAALSAATVGGRSSPRGTGLRRRSPPRSRSRPASSRSSAGLLRLGFLAGFISEPVLKGFIVGLALTIIIGQLPKLGGLERGEGDFFEQAWDLVASLGEVDVTTLAVGLLSLAVVIGRGGSRPASRGRSSPSRSACRCRRGASLDDHGVAIVGAIDSGCRRWACRTSAHRLPGARGRRGGHRAGRLRGGPRRGQDLRRPRALRRSTSNRELVGLGAANLARGLRSGMVVNGSLSKTAVNGAAGRAQAALGPRRRGHDGRHAAAAHRPVRVAARGDARRRRRRRGVELVDIRRSPALRRLDTSRLGRLYGHRGAARLHRRDRRDARRARLRHAAGPLHRHRRLAAAAALPRVAAERRRCSVAFPAPRDQWTDCGATRRTSRRRGSSCCASGGRACSSRTPTQVRGRIRAHAAREGTKAIVLDARDHAVRRRHRARDARASCVDELEAARRPAGASRATSARCATLRSASGWRCWRVHPTVTEAVAARACCCSRARPGPRRRARGTSPAVDDARGPAHPDTAARMAAEPRPRPRRARRAGQVVALVLVALLAILSVVGIWARNQITKTDRYVRTVAPLATTPSIQDLIVREVTSAIADPERTADFAREVLPPRAAPLATPVAGAVERFVRRSRGGLRPLTPVRHAVGGHQPGDACRCRAPLDRGGRGGPSPDRGGRRPAGRPARPAARPGGRGARAQRARAGPAAQRRRGAPARHRRRERDRGRARRGEADRAPGLGAPAAAPDRPGRRDLARPDATAAASSAAGWRSWPECSCSASGSPPVARCTSTAWRRRSGTIRPPTCSTCSRPTCAAGSCIVLAVGLVLAAGAWAIGWRASRSAGSPGAGDAPEPAPS